MSTGPSRRDLEQARMRAVLALRENLPDLPEFVAGFRAKHPDGPAIDPEKLAALDANTDKTLADCIEYDTLALDLHIMAVLAYTDGDFDTGNAASAMASAADSLALDCYQVTL